MNEMSRIAVDTQTLLALCEDGLLLAERLLAGLRQSVGDQVLSAGRLDPALLDRNQYALHGFAWQATYVEALRRTLHWARGLGDDGRLTAVEAAILRIGFAEYLAQLGSGIPMSQTEMVRPADCGLPGATVLAYLADPVLAQLADPAAIAAARHTLAEAAAVGRYGDLGQEDETIAAIRDQFTRFADTEVAPHAHGWHERDELIPLGVVQQLADMGVFGLTVREEDGGAGLGKVAMCVVSEVLSRGYIGVGSLGTRSEIAAELIGLAGTAQQKRHFLPALAAGAMLPTAVFTEPNTGSDLGSLRTRAVRDGDDYVVTGNKTWITHGARSDVLTLLVRTDPATTDYKGLSMLLAEKPRGDDANPFPAPGMSGGEIRVLGYRGMKEYEIAFEGFRVPARNLLGGVEGQGFKQLMETFESARIQTGARALGVAQNALELGTAYARDRSQFGRAIVGFPRVAAKIAWMAAETMMARQLTYYAAHRKDEGQPLRHRRRHGQAARRARRLVQRGQRPANPRRQRLRARIPDQPRALRRPHPVDLRGRGGDPGAGDRAGDPWAAELDLTPALCPRERGQQRHGKTSSFLPLPTGEGRGEALFRSIVRRRPQHRPPHPRLQIPAIARRQHQRQRRGVDLRQREQAAGLMDRRPQPRDLRRLRHQHRALEPRPARHRHQVHAVGGVRLLHPRLAVMLVVLHQDRQIRRRLHRDRGQAAGTHQHLAVTGDHQHLARGLRERQTQPEHRRTAHAAPQRQVLRAVAHRRDVPRRRAQAGHHQHVPPPLQHGAAQRLAVQLARCGHHSRPSFPNVLAPSSRCPISVAAGR